MRIAVIANTSWYLFNFRLTLMRTLAAAGHRVVAVGPADDYAEKLHAAGIRHRAIPLAGASVNPLRELRTVYALHRILREEKIELVLSYTPKGNIYAAIAAAMQGVRTVPNVSGLGRVFIRRSPLTWLVKQLYRFTFGRAVRVFFQNGEDQALFAGLRLVDAQKCVRVPGSGVDLERFSPLSHAPAAGVPRDETQPVFLLVARLLWDKGVGEYVEAARQVKQKHAQAQFRLLGFLDVQNPSAIPRAQVDAWVEEGAVTYLGATDDVLPHLQEADCVVLPSYREGCPRTLLEAAALAKPVIASDAPGCRDTVDDTVSGFLCRVRDAEDLAQKMLRMIEMDRAQREAMGLRGREKMMREFDERIVIDRYLNVVDALVGAKPVAPGAFVDERVIRG